MLRRTSDPREPIGTKRALLHVSRVLEDVIAAEAGRRGGPVATIALFQDATYFDLEVERYTRLATYGPVVAGFVGAPTHRPPGIEQFQLRSDEPLADEWTVIVLAEQGFGSMVARDLGTAVEARTLEQGRLFAYTVSTDVHRVSDAAQRVMDAAHGRVAMEVEVAIRSAISDLRHSHHCPSSAVLGRASEAALDRVLRLSARLETAESEADTDPLTGAANRRALDRFLTKVGTRSPVIGAIAFDLDGFKAVNDDHGHAAGDLVLRGFADTVRTHARPTDLFVRFGGDEFLLLCPGLDGEGPRQRARSIVDAVSELRFPPPADQVLARCSAGAGAFRAAAVDLDAVDDALYRAKQGGGGVATVGSGDPVAV